MKIGAAVFESLMLNRVLIDGTILSLVLGVITMGSLMYNARLWLNDYPKPIRDKVPPLSATEKRDRLIIVVAVLATIVVIMTASALQLRVDNGGSISFGTAFLNLYLIALVFNAFDAVVLDLLILTVFKPKFAILPGAEGMEYLFNDWRKHVGDFLKGFVFCAILSLPFAAIVSL